MSSPDDLLAAAVRGDATALQRLLVRQHAALHARLLRRLPADLRSGIDVEDISQEAYVVVFREIPHFAPGSGERGFAAWVQRIGLNKLRDAIRQRRTARRGGTRQRLAPAADHSSAGVGAWLEALVAHSQTPSRSSAEREALDAVRAALASLPPDYRKALELRYVEALPLSQAAARMGRSENAYSILCHRGLEQLRLLLARSTLLFNPHE